MALNHPPFLRIITRDDQVVCINLSQISSFEIRSQEPFTPKDGEPFKADVIRFFYHTTDKVLTFIVGRQITAEEFNYTCAVLEELQYFTEAERTAIKIAKEKDAIKKFEDGK